MLWESVSLTGTDTYAAASKTGRGVLPLQRLFQYR